MNETHANGAGDPRDSVHSLPQPDEARMDANAAFGLVGHGDREEAAWSKNTEAAKRATEAASELLHVDHVDDAGDDDAEDIYDGDEEAPINPTAANKKTRKERYVCSYLCAIARYFALTISGAALIVGLYFVIHEIIVVSKLKKDNAAKAMQIQEMTEQVDLLQQGIIAEPFQQEAVHCKDLKSLTVAGLYQDGGDSTGSSDPSNAANPNLPGYYGCVSNGSPATLLEAQKRVLDWNSVEAPSDLAGRSHDAYQIMEFGCIPASS